MSENENLDQSQLAARLAQARPLRDLARSWYALSVACRHIGALTERAIKEILYAPTNNSESESKNESNDDNPN